MDTAPEVATHRPGRGRVFGSIVEAFGDTPIVAVKSRVKCA